MPYFLVGFIDTVQNQVSLCVSGFFDVDILNGELSLRDVKSYFLIKETAGRETRKFNVKQFDHKNQNFHHKKLTKLRFQALALMKG